jgi:phage terminase large subunit-like protein
MKWIEKEGNPLYPLPKDYEELSKDGQRQARVNACRLWTAKGQKSSDIGEAFVAGMRFFDLWYLCPDRSIEFDPLFYDDDPLTTPAFHYDIQRMWATSQRNIVIAPRGSAKSFLVRKSCLFRMLSRPMFSILYATSTNDNAKGTGQALKDQFQNNKRIWDDWSCEFPDNRIVPRRGEAPFGTELMHLKNGSWLRCISAESRQRGGRPRRYVLDDPEYDPRASTSMSLIRQYMDGLLFKVVLPMVMRSGCGVDWLATFVSRRHYAWHALQTREDSKGDTVAQDPRFNLWSRMIVRAAYETEEGKVVSCWPDMWPATKKEKDQMPNASERVSLEEIREIIGTPNFLAEYMARPGEGEDIFFSNLEKEKHGWWLEKVDALFESDPLSSNTQICWVRDDETQKMSMAAFLKTVRLFMTVDTSYTATKDSDYKVACLMGCNSENELFVLDLWSKQCQEQELVKNCFAMADRWRCPTIHPEVIKQGLGLYYNLDSIVKTRARDMTGVTHLPGIKKMHPGQLEKSSKIAALSLRFEHGKIKLPLWNRQKPGWGRLFDQIEQFNPDAADGGLQHDDELDCVSMSQFVLKGRLQAQLMRGEETKSPFENLKDGHFTDENGIPYAHMLDLNKVNASEIVDLLDLQAKGEGGGESKI